MSSEIRNVVIVGSGVMGSGIAQAVAIKGFNVTVVDLNEQLIQKARNYIEKILNRVGRRKFNDD
ncbi:hypothetical protein ACKWTF_004940 [Chironomus riparius]